MDFDSGQFSDDFNGSGMFSGGNNNDSGQFPSIEDMFGRMDDDAEDAYDVNAFVRQARAKNASRFVDVGLHFFGALNHRR